MSLAIGKSVNNKPSSKDCFFFKSVGTCLLSIVLLKTNCPKTTASTFGKIKRVQGNRDQTKIMKKHQKAID